MTRMSESQTGRLYRKILRKNAKRIADDMKLTAPSADNDNIVNNIGITTAKKFTSGEGVRVGVVKNKTRNLPNFSAQALASSIEYGTVERFRSNKSGTGLRSGGGSTGAVKARPFIRPAYDKNIKAVEAGIVADIERAIQKAAR